MLFITLLYWAAFLFPDWKDSLARPDWVSASTSQAEAEATTVQMWKTLDSKVSGEPVKVLYTFWFVASDYSKIHINLCWKKKDKSKYNFLMMQEDGLIMTLFSKLLNKTLLKEEMIIKIHIYGHTTAPLYWCVTDRYSNSSNYIIRSHQVSIRLSHVEQTIIYWWDDRLKI